jgi:hypothetical protein
VIGNACGLFEHDSLSTNLIEYGGASLSMTSMAERAKLQPAALGFRVKSGWAMAALVGGTAASATLKWCAVALLSDPHFPGTKQPYHAGLDHSAQGSKTVVSRLSKRVAAAAKHSVQELLAKAQAEGYEIHGAGLVVGSLLDPASLHNEHIRAHALEGQLFRTVLQDAFRGQVIACEVMLERGAYLKAAEKLRVTEAVVKRTITQMGESHDGSWRAEEKLAALAAWTMLPR